MIHMRVVKGQRTEQNNVRDRQSDKEDRVCLFYGFANDLEGWERYIQIK